MQARNRWLCVVLTILYWSIPLTAETSSGELFWNCTKQDNGSYKLESLVKIENKNIVWQCLLPARYSQLSVPSKYFSNTTEPYRKPLSTSFSFLVGQLSIKHGIIIADTSGVLVVDNSGKITTDIAPESHQKIPYDSADYKIKYHGNSFSGTSSPKGFLHLCGDTAVYFNRGYLITISTDTGKVQEKIAFSEELLENTESPYQKAAKISTENVQLTIHGVIHPVFQNDAVVLGILMVVLALIFVTSSSENKFWQTFYTYVPSLLLCYFIPSILGTFNIISGSQSDLYFVASRYLLPSCLVLLTLSIDFKGILKLGPKALIMFFTATIGIIIGGPIAILIASAVIPDVITPDLWRGMSTVAGSWIGGGANQAAMKEVFGVSESMFSSMVTVDVLVANVWMAFLLFGASRYQAIDNRIKADNSSIEELKNRVAKFQADIAKIPTTKDLMVLLAVCFGITAISHYFADFLAPWIQENAPFLAKFSLTKSFFWLIVISTTGGLALSFTKIRNLEGVGASKMGSVFIYVLVATIGMKMDILAITRTPELFVLGGIWISVHIILLLTVAYFIRAPFFYVAVGSQANIGGAASAPIVASAFHPALASVGVLLAVLGYALGTYGALICAWIMQFVSS